MKIVPAYPAQNRTNPSPWTHFSTKAFLSKSIPAPLPYPAISPVLFHYYFHTSLSYYEFCIFLILLNALLPYHTSLASPFPGFFQESIGLLQQRVFGISAASSSILYTLGSLPSPSAAPSPFTALWQSFISML